MNTQTKKIETTEKITDNIEKYRIPDAKRTPPDLTPREYKLKRRLRPLVREDAR